MRLCSRTRDPPTRHTHGGLCLPGSSRPRLTTQRARSHPSPSGSSTTAESCRRRGPWEAGGSAPAKSRPRGSAPSPRRPFLGLQSQQGKKGPRHAMDRPPRGFWTPEQGWEVLAVAPGEWAPVQLAASKSPDEELGGGGRWGQGEGDQRGPELGQAEATWRPGESLLQLIWALGGAVSPDSALGT